jgi:hypothetical protein
MTQIQEGDTDDTDDGHGDQCGTDLVLGGGGYQVGMGISLASRIRWTMACNVKSVSTCRCH